MIDTIQSLWIRRIAKRLEAGALLETETFYSDNRDVRNAIEELARDYHYAYLVGTWNGKPGVRIFPNSVVESNRFFDGLLVGVPGSLNHDR